MPKQNTIRRAAQPDASERRLSIVVFLLVLWMAGIGARLVYLQVWQHERWTTLARAQQGDGFAENPRRGQILDRRGRELARSLSVESFFAVPGEIHDIESAANRLAPVLNTDARALAERLRAARTANRRFVWIARRLDDEQARAVRALSIGGIHSLPESRRHYPNGALAAHVLGFTGLDDDGLAGIERFQEARLAGEEGRTFVNTDARRRPYQSDRIEARDGQSVVLTIDATVQFFAEQALSRAVAQSRARAGAAIVLDPRTGEILALANAPTFDPNNAVRLTDAERTNQSLQNIYEPGSTFKIVAFSAALEEGLARPDERIDCQMGAITVAGRRIRDHTAFGTLTMTEALARSSNVAAIKLGLRVGDRRMHDYITRFGFGARTGIELSGETRGLVRPVANWQPSSIGSIAIGQEIGVTPLQMVAAFGAIANDGVRISPHLVREVRDAQGTVINRTVPEQHRVVSAETARTLRGMLETVTLQGGTATSAQLEGYTAAGKTGTAQKIDPQTRGYSSTKFIASFVGFAPATDPSVVIIVVIDEPGGAYHGGQVAAPVFREIAEAVLPYLNTLPDRAPEGNSPLDSLLARTETANRTEQIVAHASAQISRPEIEQRADGNEVVFIPANERAFRMPDLRGQSVRDAAMVCAQLGLRLEARGEGRALGQQPAPGADVRAGQIVRVELGRSE
jgi:cell division protein FtsI (penicillin-binding protein 3)